MKLHEMLEKRAFWGKALKPSQLLPITDDLIKALDKIEKSVLFKHYGKDLKAMGFGPSKELYKIYRDNPFKGGMSKIVAHHNLLRNMSQLSEHAAGKTTSLVAGLPNIDIKNLKGLGI